MPAAEIAAAVTVRSALEIAKAMVGLRDAEAFRAKSIELQTVILESLDKAIEARCVLAASSQQARRSTVAGSLRAATPRALTL
jgi:hypothetical protein